MQVSRGITNRRFASLLTFGVLTLSFFLPTITSAQATPDALSSQADEIRELQEVVRELQAEVAELKRELHGPRQESVSATQPATAVPAVLVSTPQPPQSTEGQTTRNAAIDFLDQTVIEIGLDGYYEYNFNSPTGRVNLLRAYDVSSNSFSLNQANFIIKRVPDLSTDRRLGLRLDFQYGQATETLQGSAANELRPQVYRPLFQAYGTYIFPVGSGLTVDFGKWASALGFENNYSKDQINYSRSYFFNFLPFYHMGLRAGYNLTPKINLTYWLVNGAQQTEDFNGFKSQAFIFTVKPTANISWNVNYYFGQEQRDVVPVLNPGLSAAPAQPGLPVSNVIPVPNGREHILDSYLSWNITPKLTLGGEGDYVINRVFEQSPPAHVIGGAGYARYQLTPKAAVAGRGEYFSDRGGLFSGISQALKEVTLTYDYKLAQGFLLRSEWRRDFSNKQFFLTDRPGILSNHQNTATMGLMWWWGNKEESW